ncbi:hypothetical protein T4B_4353 [Trichinella pseudospiralis]|uniref:Uncharacterized protein n=3 Tax=Trichinella TaxID=6333 RepID=A0A0V1H028_TRIPS|nr:hypothetical protein T4A_5549 [Trichinella pseudospiralis]KRZ01866.1 hypothetical protein T11_12215 [Trichinella zimbabwensis]KRZ66243.1 hypothetical protein T10_10778 [Trichinella papuae]KRY65160.1 hypothetical protein T4A_13929 [Trichinella pseudospiralis]KRY74695.1 hypothetical protein T4A_2264 [Trichinella pseudospiralis]
MVHGIIEYDLGSILLVFEPEIMIERNRRGHSYCCVRGEILGSQQDEQLRKHLPRITKVRGSKAIRYRPSSNGKLCQPAIRRSSFKTRRAASGKPKCFGSGGSMVAKLKLKGIDGRAPPGVEPAA